MNQSRVVLLHGLGRDKKIMAPLEKRLVRLGYVVHNDDYLSMKNSVEAAAAGVVERVQSCFGTSDEPIHWVGHSLGGIIIRYIMAHYSFHQRGRVVMMGSPNQGTPVVDFLRRFKWYRRHYGPAGQQLGTKEDGIVKQLPPFMERECGIIAGNRTVDPWFSWTVLSGPDDGKVTVESTKLSKMTDFTVVPVAHPHLPLRESVMNEVVCFLETGHFEPK